MRRNDLLGYEQALNLIQANVQDVLETIRLPYELALGRVLAEDVLSDVDQPPFDKSAMDGYACKYEDLGVELKLIGQIQAGSDLQIRVRKGECVSIMTGARMPEGADGVVMKEDVTVAKDLVSCTNPHSKKNICYKGEDVKKGDVIVSKNTILEPHHFPLLASVGKTNVLCHKNPKIGVYATGKELISPEEKPLGSQIRNSNSIQILMQLKAMGTPGNYEGILDDKTEIIASALESSMQENKITIMTGGVSVGDFDLIPEIIQKVGGEIHIHGTAIQPGKPMVFAQKDGHYFFGLSGNPVSSFIQFVLYVKPFIQRLQGGNLSSVLTLPLKGTFSRKRGGRTKFLPAYASTEGVAILPFNGSAHIAAFAKANCLIQFDRDVLEVSENDSVRVIML